MSYRRNVKAVREDLSSRFEAHSVEHLITRVATTPESWPDSPEAEEKYGDRNQLHLYCCEVLKARLWRAYLDVSEHCFGLLEAGQQCLAAACLAIIDLHCPRYRKDQGFVGPWSKNGQLNLSQYRQFLAKDGPEDFLLTGNVEQRLMQRGFSLNLPDNDELSVEVDSLCEFSFDKIRGGAIPVVFTAAPPRLRINPQGRLRVTLPDQLCITGSNTRELDLSDMIPLSWRLEIAYRAVLEVESVEDLQFFRIAHAPEGRHWRQYFDMLLAEWLGGGADVDKLSERLQSARERMAEIFFDPSSDHEVFGLQIRRWSRLQHILQFGKALTGTRRKLAALNLASTSEQDDEQ